MTAAQYVSKYHTISVPEYRMQGGKMDATSFVNTPVDEYLNRLHANRAGYSHEDRWKLRGGIYKFLKEHASMPDKPVSKIGTGYCIKNSIFPCTYVDKTMMNDAFLGKAAPEVLQAVIHVISYWRGWRVLEGGTPVPSMPDMVDKFLGSDCNGFVGNYMKEKYKDQGFKLGPSTPEEDFFYNRQSIRDIASEIRADDVVLLNRTPNPNKGESPIDWNQSAKDLEAALLKQRSMIGHIMVISSVGAAGADHVDVMISESQTRHEPNGGPQTNAYTLKRMGKYRWKMLGRDREIHSIIKVKRTG